MSHTVKCLEANFSLKAPCWKRKYRFKVLYWGNNEIKTYLVDPFLKPKADIHLLNGQELCLYFHNVFTRFNKMVIARDIVTACFDWANNYEYILACPNAKWVGNQRWHGEHKVMEDYQKLKCGRNNLFITLEDEAHVL